MGSNGKPLQDLDNSTVMEDGRKKLNTIFHYQVRVSNGSSSEVLVTMFANACVPFSRSRKEHRSP